MVTDSVRLEESDLRRVRVGFRPPNLMVARLNAEAKRRGVTRQAPIKMWLAEKLDRAS